MRDHARLWLAVFAGFLACGIGTTVAVLATRKTDALGFEQVAIQVTTRPWLLVGLPLAMLLGIWTNAVWTQLDSSSAVAGDDEVHIWLAIRKAVKSRHFWQSILVSPIVYASVYTLSRHEPDVVVGILLAFQNGFFWNAVLEGKRSKIAI